MIFQFFGTVNNPLTALSPGAADRRLTGNGGLIAFVTSIIRLVIIAGGVLVLINFVLAGLQYINSQGDPKIVESARDKMTTSVIGLIIMVGSIAFMAILGFILFGRWDAILNPVILGPGETI